MDTPTRCRLTALPEYHQYADQGCILAPSCLACPYPVCYHDNPSFLDTLRRHHLAQALRARVRQGMTIPAAGRSLGLQWRTAYRLFHLLDKPPDSC